MLRFSDGINIDTSGKPRILTLDDGLYVVGGGCMEPVNSRQEADEILAEELAAYEREEARKKER